MQFRVHRRRQAPTVIIVALIDVLIVLLIFLMVTTTFNQRDAVTNPMSAVPSTLAIADHVAPPSEDRNT